MSSRGGIAWTSAAPTEHAATGCAGAPLRRRRSLAELAGGIVFAAGVFATSARGLAQSANDNLGEAADAGAADAGSESAEQAVRDVASIAAVMRRSLSGIESIAYSFTQRDRRPSGPGPIGQRPIVAFRSRGKFAYSGGKFFSEFEVFRDGIHSISARVAFDGKVYQRFDPVKKDLNVSSEIPQRPYVCEQPLLYPFAFLLGPLDRTDLETAASEAVWREFTTKARLGTPRNIGEHECDVIEFTRSIGSGDVQQAWEICAARDLHFYPIEQSSRHGQVRARLRVLSHEVLDGSHGPIVVPTSLAIEASQGDVSLKDEKIEVSIEGVNESIPVVRFVLTPSKAKVVRYVDPTAAEVRRPARPRRGGLGSAACILWLFIGGGAFALGVALWRRARRK